MPDIRGATPPLPRPFYEAPWPASLRPHARALWDWHLALDRLDAATVRGITVQGITVPAADGAFFEAEAARAAGAAPLTVVPGDVCAAAYAACRAQGLPFELLAQQVRAAHAFTAPLRFATASDARAFLAAWAVPHARLLARLAGAAGSWQLPLVDELCSGFFWVGRLAYLPHDLARDRLYFPLDELASDSVDVERLRAGQVDEGVRRLFWRQTVRAQNGLAGGEPLVQDLPRRFAGALKRYWFGSLEVLNEIRRRDYDVWSRPVALSFRNRLQIQYQSRFGRTTFRS